MKRFLKSTFHTIPRACSEMLNFWACSGSAKDRRFNILQYFKIKMVKLILRKFTFSLWFASKKKFVCQRRLRFSRRNQTSQQLETVYRADFKQFLCSHIKTLSCFDLFRIFYCYFWTFISTLESWWLLNPYLNPKFLLLKKYFIRYEWIHSCFIHVIGLAYVVTFWILVAFRHLVTTSTTAWRKI